ncbi:addiction module antidote protein, HigA family [Vibrio cholerae]|nr:addiction module antidote protein, HigA family [Vibrio cholerae]
MFTLANPMHPGAFLKEAYMDPMDIKVTQLADIMGVSKSSVSRLITGKSDLSYEMALRLENVKSFKRSASGWMNLQTAYGLYQAKRRLELETL